MYKLVLLTLENSTPANLYPAGVQKARHDSIVMLLTSVKEATRSVREIVMSLVYNVKCILASGRL